MGIAVDASRVLELLGESGEQWTKSAYVDAGKMCLFGAVRRCVPVRADAALVEQVAELQGWGASWNDDVDTTFDAVRSRIVTGLSVSDTDLADTFGPQWEHVVALVRRVGSLTDSDRQMLLEAAELTIPFSDTSDLSQHVVDAAHDTGSYAQLYCARGAAWDTLTQSAARFSDAELEAVFNAVAALVLRHLVGTCGFEQVHYDSLTYPWRAAVGPLHPDDSACRPPHPVQDPVF
jgi:hypothetical protein